MTRCAPLVKSKTRCSGGRHALNRCVVSGRNASGLDACPWTGVNDLFPIIRCSVGSTQRQQARRTHAQTRTISPTRWQHTHTITLCHHETRLVLTENVARGINIVAHDAELKENTFGKKTNCTRIRFFGQTTEMWTRLHPAVPATEQQDRICKSLARPFDLTSSISAVPSIISRWQLNTCAGFS